MIILIVVNICLSMLILLYLTKTVIRKIFKQLITFFIKIVVVTYGGINIREVLCKIYLTFGWIETEKSSMLKISNNIIAENKQIEVANLKAVEPFMFMNRYENGITSLLCKAINARIFKESYIPFVEQVRASLDENKNNITGKWLAGAEFLAMTGGLFVLGFDFRKYNIRYLEAKYSNRRKIQYFDIRKLYFIYLVTMNFKEANDTLSKAGRWWKYIYRNRYYVMSVVANENMLSELPSLRLNSEENRAYFNIINGKSIAIIGPSEGVLNIDEITRDFDIKIHITYRGSEFLSEDRQKCGIDVSYYNRDHALHFAKEGNPQILDELKMSVFNSAPHRYQKELINKKIGRVKVRPVDDLIFQGNANMVQNILLDLFHFSPAKIKLFNINLFLTCGSNRYHNGYQFNYSSLGNTLSNDTGAKQYWYVYAQHNMICNYEITKLWYDAGYFEADERLAYILSLGVSEYLRQMEELN